MFSALRQGSPFYVLEKADKPTLKIGSVDKVSAPRYGTTAPFVMVVDITAIVGGEKVDYKGVPSNTAIADFGNGIIISESKEAMMTEVDNMLQSSKLVLDNIDYHRKVVESYSEIMNQLNPSAAKEQLRDEAISSLAKRVDTIQGGLDKILSLLTAADKNDNSHGNITRTESWLPEQENGEADLQVHG